MRVTPELLLHAYSIGVFPMAPSATSEELRWFEPELRGIIPLDGFHVPASLRQAMRRSGLEVASDQDFEAVTAACAAPTEGRETTWISSRIRDLYGALHRMGFAHSIECRREGRLVGGLYGVHLGAAFFGESMFSRERDASKIALVHLVARLKHGGFRLLDTQFVTPHLARFGAVEIPRETYRRLLSDAIDTPRTWPSEPPPETVDRILKLGTRATLQPRD